MIRERFKIGEYVAYRYRRKVKTRTPGKPGKPTKYTYYYASRACLVRIRKRFNREHYRIRFMCPNHDHKKYEFLAKHPTWDAYVDELARL